MTVPPDPPERVRTLVRVRNGLFLATLLVPAALFVLFGRQFDRLEALAAHGAPTEAVITAVRSGYVSYTWEVGGQQYTWEVAGERPLGARVPVVYLPEAPSFARPDWRPPASEAARNRSFAWKIELGALGVLGGLTWAVDRDVRRARAGWSPGPVDPRAYRQRMMWAGGALVVAAGGVVAFHASDALEKGESLVPVVLAGVLVVAILAGTISFVGRDGPAGVRERAGRLTGWVLPFAVGIALLRLLLLVAGV